MRFTKILLAAAILFTPLGGCWPVRSQTVAPFHEDVLRGSIVLSQAPSPTTATNPAAGPAPVVSAPVADPKTGTFVTVKDGVTVVPGGSIIGELLMWLVLVLGVPLAGLLVSHVILPFAKKMGVEVSTQNSAKLETTIANGLALAAQRAQVSLKDKLDINVRSGVAVTALQYVQDHGAETLKAMGVPDATDPKVMEALQARIAKAMDDKLAPPTVSVAAIAAPISAEPGKV